MKTKETKKKDEFNESNVISLDDAEDVINLE